MNTRHPLAIAALVLAATAVRASTQADASEIVVRASDISQGTLHGGWTLALDPTSADDVKLATWDQLSIAGDAQATGSVRRLPLAAPDDYFDLTFFARAGVPYRVWLRLKTNEAACRSPLQADCAPGSAGSVWLQFSDAEVAGARAYAIDTPSGLFVTAQPCGGCSPSGWGWQDSSWSLRQPSTITFATSGLHTVRVQPAAGGVQVDQIVLSAGLYMKGPPGAPQDDLTIVSRQ